MNKNTNNVKGILSSRKAKYGIVSIVFTVVFCAVIILLNAVIGMIADENGGWFKDLSSKKNYELSNESIDVIKNVKNDVEILFCTTEDKVEDNIYLSYVNSLAKQYRKYNKSIEINYKDYIKEPLYFDKYKTGGYIYSDSVIVSCEDTGRFVVYSLKEFFAFHNVMINGVEQLAIFGYDGEDKLTSAILQTANSSPLKAGIISNHGGYTVEGLDGFLRNSGYEVEYVDLRNIPENELYEIDVLLLLAPTIDLSGVSAADKGDVNEVDKLDRYLKGNFGNLMVFLHPTNEELPELSGYLKDTWGVGYLAGSTIIENSSVVVDNINDSKVFLGTPVNDGGYGSELHAPVTSEGKDSTAFYMTVPLYTVKNENVDVSSVFRTSPSANRVTKDGQTVDAARTPIMTLSKYFQLVDNKEQESNVIVCGSLLFLDLIDNAGYTNKDLMKSVFAEMGNESVVVGIDMKLEVNDVITVTDEEFYVRALVLAIYIPLIIALVGVIVYIVRQRMLGGIIWVVLVVLAMNLIAAFTKIELLGTVTLIATVILPLLAAAAGIIIYLMRKKPEDNE